MDHMITLTTEQPIIIAGKLHGFANQGVPGGIEKVTEEGKRGVLSYN